jgi:hypothetical protein
MIVFMNDSFIIRIDTEMSLTELSRAEFTSAWAHLAPPK